MRRREHARVCLELLRDLSVVGDALGVEHLLHLVGEGLGVLELDDEQVERYRVA